MLSFEEIRKKNIKTAQFLDVNQEVRQKQGQEASTGEE